MKMLGSVELATHRRITMPEKVLSALGTKEGDFIVFFEDKGTVFLKPEKG